MKRGIRTVTVAVAALVVLALAGVASAAYNTPKLSVTYLPGNITRIIAAAGVDDDATARAAIYVPTGTTLPATVPAPGTKVGTVAAQVSALALGGALLPLTGDIVVAPPGAVPAASQLGCIGPVTPAATMLLVLQAAGQTLNVPAYLVVNTGAEATYGPAKLVFCLPPPDVPVDKGGATFGAKFLSADLTLNGVFGPVTQGTWIGMWLPWSAGTGTVNVAGAVGSPAFVAPGALTLTGKKVAGRKVLAGKLSQGGTGLAGRVQIWGATGTAFKLLKSVTSTAGGVFAFTPSKASKATRFQARTVAVGRPFPTGCSTLTLPAPCVNATINGFLARSKTVTLR